MACEYGRYEIIKSMIAKGVSSKPFIKVNVGLMSLANDATMSGDFRILEEICKAGAKLTDMGYLGKSGTNLLYGDSLAAAAFYG